MQRGTSTFFLFVNYFDAHQPYDPPAPFRNRFTGADPVLGPRVPERSEIGQVLGGEQDIPDERKAHLEALYDAELLYLDTHLARLLERLRKHPAWEEMLVVVTADHGEAFGEHGLDGHSDLLYDVILHVPMILRTGRGGPFSTVPPRGRRWHRPMQLVDVMPLALAHAGIDANIRSDGTAPDTSAVPLRAWAFPSPSRIEAGDRFRRERRSIEMAGLKLIEDNQGNVELYNVRADPGEEIDLAGEQPEQVTLLRARLGPRVAYRERPSSSEEPMSSEGLERLRSLGYVR